MPRARNIKPAFFQNEDLVDLPYETRLLFIGLWTLADREGRLEDRPKKIKMSLFPADDIDINQSLSDLGANKFVLRYEVDKVKYIQILNFTKHQKPHHQEKDSVIPEPDLSGEGASLSRSNRPDSLNLIADTLNTHTARERICINFSPDPETVAYCKARRLPDPTDQDHIDAFINKNLSSNWQSANWQAEYRTFLTKQKTGGQAHDKESTAAMHARVNSAAFD